MITLQRIYCRRQKNARFINTRFYLRLCWFGFFFNIHKTEKPTETVGCRAGKKIPISSNQSETWVANALKLLNKFLLLWVVNTGISVVKIC